jgi:elongation factor P--(R)-beta-lysine ligase
VLVGGSLANVRLPLLALADALGHVDVSLAPSEAPPELRVGDLVLVAGRLNWPEGGAPGLKEARIVERFAGVEPTARGERAHLAWSGRGRALAARSRALDVVRDYFRGQGFLEVDTPLLVPCPGLDPNVDSLGSVTRGARVDWLITSPELHMKRLLVGGLPRIFQLARCFRAEELGRHHEPEFTMLEWYRAFAGYEEALCDTEQIVSRVVRALAGDAFARVREADGSVRFVDVTPPFERVSVRAAFAEHAGVSDAVRLAQEDAARYFQLLVERVEPALAKLPRPVFLVDYPASQAALARRSPSDPTVAERFELYVGGVELSNGFGELTDAAEQRRRFEAERARRSAVGAPAYPLDERFLGALEEGMPPATGNALGFDRLVMLALGVGALSDVFAFPDVAR